MPRSLSDVPFVLCSLQFFDVLPHEQPGSTTHHHPGFHFSIIQPVVKGLPGDLEEAAYLRGGQYI